MTAGNGREVEGRMRFRKLRIAWSVAWSVLCVLLVMLWVRSNYWRADRLHCPLWDKQAFVVASMYGRVTVVAYEPSPEPNEWKNGYFSYRVDDQQAFPGYVSNSVLGFGRLQRPFHYVPEVVVPMPGKPAGWNTVYNAGATMVNGSGVFVPDWFLVGVAGGLAVAPWLKLSRRFSLRTLLIATTLVAVVLGLIVAVLRWPAG